MALWPDLLTITFKFSAMHISRILIAFVLSAGSLAAEVKSECNKHYAKIIYMDTSKLSNPIVRSAFEAWQKGDSQKWLSHFTKDAQLLDDGRPRDFQKFSTEAIGTERFISIDIVKDNGRSIYGKFHSDTWGNFKTYFKFHIDASSKIYKLEIGQADY